VFACGNVSRSQLGEVVFDPAGNERALLVAELAAIATQRTVLVGRVLDKAIDIAAAVLAIEALTDEQESIMADLYGTAQEVN